MTSSPLLPRVKFLLNTGETDRATDDGLATDTAGMTGAAVAEEAADETEEEARIETPPPPPLELGSVQVVDSGAIVTVVTGPPAAIATVIDDSETLQVCAVVYKEGLMENVFLSEEVIVSVAAGDN